MCRCETYNAALVENYFSVFFMTNLLLFGLAALLL